MKLCQAVEPAASVSVTEVPQLTPSRDSSSARERLGDVGSTAGATTVTVTFAVGTSVGPDPDGRGRTPPSASTMEPPVSTAIAGLLASMIEAPTPSVGMPAHALPVTVDSTEFATRPECPRRSSDWTAGAVPAMCTVSLPRPPKIEVSTEALVLWTEKVSSPSMP